MAQKQALLGLVEGGFWLGSDMSEFVRSLDDVFTRFGPIRAKRMFGGYGIYHDELMFGLVADDVLYLKTDEKTVTAFTEKKMRPFEYEKNGRRIHMSYYTAPEEIFDDPDAANEWAARAFEAALRARRPKRGAGAERTR